MGSFCMIDPYNFIQKELNEASGGAPAGDPLLSTPKPITHPLTCRHRQKASKPATAPTTALQTAQAARIPLRLSHADTKASYVAKHARWIRRSTR